MRKYPIFTAFTFAAAATFGLTACDSANIDSPATHSAYRSPTPVQLRSIPVTELTAEVTIDDKTTTYQAQDYPDGNWVISIPVEFNKQYKSDHSILTCAPPMALLSTLMQRSEHNTEPWRNFSIIPSQENRFV